MNMQRPGSVPGSEPAGDRGGGSGQAGTPGAWLHRGGLAWRAGGALAGLALAAVAMAQQHALAARQEQMAAWLVAGGATVPRELEYEPDPGRVDLRAARAALAAELDPTRRADLPAAGDDGRQGTAASRLAETAGLAGAGLTARPAAWEAAMVLGAATYLSWSQAHDTRLFTQAPTWERPLEAAMALAPGRTDAARLLAAAYLELWPQLSAAKREREKQLLTSVFADPQVLAGLLAPWLTTAASRAEAFAVIPHDPEAWDTVQQFYSQHADWTGYCAARDRWNQVLRESLAYRLAATAERPGAPDARERFLAIAAEARPGRSYLSLLTRALESCPPGSVDHRTAERLARQLAWNLDRCRLFECPLPQRPLARLAGFCRDLDPRLDAMAAVVTGDLPRAEVLERTYATAWSEEWAPYRLLKAKMLLAKGHAAADAQDALVELPHSWLDRPNTWQVKAAIAHAAGDAAGETAAAQALTRLAAREWPAAAWDVQGATSRLELLAAGEAPAFIIAVDAAPLLGAAVEVRLDDSVVGAFPVAPGATLTLPAALGPGLHLLEIESVAGGAVRPGRVRLAAGSGAGSGTGTATATE